MNEFWVYNVYPSTGNQVQLAIQNKGYECRYNNYQGNISDYLRPDNVYEIVGKRDRNMES